MVKKYDKWISVKDEWPKLGQKVLLFSCGSIQEDIYMLDKFDENDCEIEYFWSTESICKCLDFSENDYWMPLPEPPK